jgi:hypothetical protein
VELIRALVDRLDAKPLLKHLVRLQSAGGVVLCRCAAAENVSPSTSTWKPSSEVGLLNDTADPSRHYERSMPSVYRPQKSGIGA